MSIDGGVKRATPAPVPEPVPVVGFPPAPWCSDSADVVVRWLHSLWTCCLWSFIIVVMMVLIDRIRDVVCCCFVLSSVPFRCCEICLRFVGLLLLTSGLSSAVIFVIFVVILWLLGVVEPELWVVSRCELWLGFSS